MNDDISLQHVFDALLELGVIRPSRVGPIRTALKQYARMLGFGTPAECAISACLKPDKIRNRMIEELAPPPLASHGVRNLKNNVAFVLRKAIEAEIVSPLESELSWKDCKNTRVLPRRNEHVCSPKYVIDPVPLALEEEITAYEDWSTRISNRARPKSLRKRPISFREHRTTILQAAGYLVKYKGREGNCIKLITLVEPNNAIDYVEWRIEQQSKYTAGSASTLAHIAGLARYLEIAADSSEQKSMIEGWRRELRNFRASLGTPRKVQEQNKRWLSLSQLEMVGRSIYPLNARRVKELSRSSRARVSCDPNRISERSGMTFQLYAFRVLQSLLVRLLIRIPLRQRNLREMLWNPASPEDGQNLYKKNGVWYLRFRGPELKISEVKGEVHSLAYEFPNDLVDLLEEWLYKWRPILIAGQKDNNKGEECLSLGREFVFVNRRGRALTMPQVTLLVKKATFKFTGVAVNPHMIRTIFATEYIKATNNFIDPAYMLGDDVKTVINTYAKLLDEDCGKRASEWISGMLHGEPPDGNGAVLQSKLPKLQYPRGH